MVRGKREWYILREFDYGTKDKFLDVHRCNRKLNCLNHYIYSLRIYENSDIQNNENPCFSF